MGYNTDAECGITHLVSSLISTSSLLGGAMGVRDSPPGSSAPSAELRGWE